MTTGAVSAFVAEVPLRFSDFDVFGHVNHAVYLALCEEHREAFFAHWESRCGSQPLDAGFVVAEVAAKYLAPLGRGAHEVTVSMWVEQIGRTSMRLRYHVDLAQDRCAVVHYVLVMVTAQGRPRQLCDGERAVLAEFLEAS